MKRRRRVLIVLAIILAVLLIGGIVLKAYLNSERLTAIIKSRVQERLGVEPELAGADLSLFGGLSLHGFGFEIQRDERTTTVKVPEINVKFSLLRLLSGGGIVDRVTVTTPRIKMRIPDVVVPEKDEDAPPPNVELAPIREAIRKALITAGEADIHVPSVTVQDADFQLEERDSGQVFELKDIDLAVESVGRNKVDASFSLDDEDLGTILLKASWDRPNAAVGLRYDG